ncbi:MAG: ABC transporter ATP-binding protein [Balneolales bacterium]
MYNYFIKLFYLLPKGDLLKLIFLFFMMLLASILEVAGIGIIPLFVSMLADPNQVLGFEILQVFYKIFSIEDSEDLLIVGSFLLILIFIIKNTYITYFKYIQSKFVWNRFKIISSTLFKKYMNAPYEFHLNRNSSELLRNVTQEAQHLVKFVMVPLLNISMEVVVVIGILMFLVVLEPLITFGVFILLGFVGGGFLKLIKKKTKLFGKQAQKDRAHMIKAVQEGVGGIKDIKILGRESWFEVNLNKHLKSYTKSQTFREVASQATKPVMETFAVIGMLCIALILFGQGRSLSVVIAVLTLFGAATIRLMPALQHIIQHWTNLRYYIHTIDPIFNDTKLLVHSHYTNSKKKQDLTPFKESINFDNVSFSYFESKEKAVKKLSFKIRIGEAVGFVGSSGAGKTTVIDLLLGLLEPDEGKVLVDNLDIKNNIWQWRSLIGYIPQYIYLKDSSIRENIAFGLPTSKIENKKIEKALEVANLSELIDNLPEGLDTKTGEGGMRLSGGQRQRIGIARALYHNPMVVVMDEATSALDNITESIIMNAIEKLKGKKTVIMIAHRISTVKNCDTIYYMENGHIIQSGSYESLIMSNNNFRKMCLEKQN